MLAAGQYHHLKWSIPWPPSIIMLLHISVSNAGLCKVGTRLTNIGSAPICQSTRKGLAPGQASANGSCNMPPYCFTYCDQDKSNTDGRRNSIAAGRMPEVFCIYTGEIRQAGWTQSMLSVRSQFCFSYGLCNQPERLLVGLWLVTDSCHASIISL